MLPLHITLSAGADINGNSQGILTPLYGANVGNHVDVVEFLLDKGADVNISRGRDAMVTGGMTLSDIARRGGHTEIVELLREHGAKD